MVDGLLECVNMSLPELISLFKRRWTVPVLAQLLNDSGCKFVTLVNKLGVSRESLRRTLDALIVSEWVAKNPGHGHPLRPEYVLTRAGKRLAKWSVRAMVVLRAMRVEEITCRKWSMPVAWVLRSGRMRFSIILATVGGLTPRALAIALRQMEEFGLVARAVSDDYPPGTFYRLTRLGSRLIPLLKDY